MNISCIRVGFLKSNCYLIEKNNKCLLVDPGDDLDAILEFIDGKDIVGILVTHSHFDHVASVADLVEKYGYIVYDLNNLNEGINKVDEFEFEVIKTFGHTMDCVCYFFKKEKIMFTGDFLFKGTIGRCDLLESNFDVMKESILKIKKYDDDIVIYPGHGGKTILGEEKINNTYFES